MTVNGTRPEATAARLQPSQRPRTSTTGQERDETGLLFFNARYYDPVLARFVSPDTIAPGTVGSDSTSALTVALVPGKPDLAAEVRLHHRLGVSKR